MNFCESPPRAIKISLFNCMSVSYEWLVFTQYENDQKMLMWDLRWCKMQSGGRLFETPGAWGQFHQHFSSNFYTHRSWKRKKHWWLGFLLGLLGSELVKLLVKCCWNWALIFNTQFSIANVPEFKCWDWVLLIQIMWVCFSGLSKIV